jgi:hypothetical protein
MVLSGGMLADALLKADALCLLTHCHHLPIRVSRPSQGPHKDTLGKLRLRCRLRLFL